MRDEREAPVTSSLIRVPAARAYLSFLIPLVLFAALAVLFLAPCLLDGRALLPTDFLMRMSPWAQQRAARAAPVRPEPPWNPILWDAMAQFYPWRAFAAHWMRRGVIPLWDPHQFCGTPFLANSQSAVLYPLHLMLLDLPAGLPVARAMALLAAVHLTLAGFLTFLWLRALRLSPFAAGLGGIAFMLSGFAVTWLELPSFLTVACWLPFLFLTVHRAVERPGLPRTAALAGAIGLTLLGGHLQVAFYCLLGAGLYAGWAMGVQAFRRSGVQAFRGSVSTRTEQEQEQEQEQDANTRTPERLNARTPFLLVLGVILGGMLAAPQLLPAVELSRHSHRVSPASTAGYDAYVRGAMPAAQLVRLFLPDFYGNPTRDHYEAGSPADYTEYAGYFGGVGLLLAVVGLLAWRRRRGETLFAAALMALSLLLALGTPLNALLYFVIPGFSQSGSPARVLVLFCFTGAWLAGLGAQALLDSGSRLPAVGTQLPAHGAGSCEPRAGSWEPRASSRLPVLALVVWTALLGAALIAARAFVEGQSDDFGELLARSGAALQRTVALAALAALLPPGLQWLGRRSSVSPLLAESLGRVVLGALLLGELWAFGAGFNPTGPLADVYPKTPLIAALRNGPAASVGRVLPVNRRWSLLRNPRALLPPNSALALGLLDPQGYDSLFMGSYKGFTNLAQGADTAPLENGNMVFFSNLSSPLLPLLAADRVVVDPRPGVPDAPLPDWPLLYKWDDLRVYRCPLALPRAFVAPRWRAVPEAALPGELQRLAAGHGLGGTALVAKATGDRRQATGRAGDESGGGRRYGGAAGRREAGAPSPVGLREVGPDEVVLTVPQPHSGMLVLLDNDHPGWRASDADTRRPLSLKRVDLAFRGVPLTGESRAVRLRYEPASFRLGLYLAAMAVAFLTGVAAAGRRVMR
jgi:hypothetical protein